MVFRVSEKPTILQNHGITFNCYQALAQLLYKHDNNNGKHNF